LARDQNNSELAV